MYFEHDHNQPSSWTTGTLKQFGDDDQIHFAVMLQNSKHYNSRFLCNFWAPISVCYLVDNHGGWLWWRLVHQKLHWPGDGSIMKDIRRLDKTAFTSFPLSFYGSLLVLSLLRWLSQWKRREIKSYWSGSRTPPRLPIWWWSLLPQDNIGACPYSVLPVFSPVFFTQFSRPYLAHCFYSWNILLPVKLKYPRIRSSSPYDLIHVFMGDKFSLSDAGVRDFYLVSKLTPPVHT